MILVKFALILCGLMLWASLQAAPLPESGKYSVLPDAFSDAAGVEHFFSFNCTACYHFEEQKINEQVKHAIPAGITSVKYHISSMGALGQALSQAWAVAVLLNVEPRITIPMFEAVQRQSRIHNEDDIRQVFLDNGVTADEYDGAWNSFAVKGLVQRQKDAEARYRVSSVPDTYVKGKYRLLSVGMDSVSAEAFTTDYIRTILFLLAQS